MFIEMLYFSTRAEEVALTGWSEHQCRSFLTQQHRAQHYHYQTHYPAAQWLIVERDGERIGRLYLDEERDRVLIIDISLLPASRGEGIGEALLRDTLKWAGSTGCAVSIHVEKSNRARHLYDRLGFGLVEDKGVYDLMEWRMEQGAV
ncbi:MAG: GNAT family N-acetyltransferase [Pseudomonadota bacterium]